MKVLIVDDHSLVSEGIALILKKLHPDAQAVCASSLANARLTLSNQAFDLVLLDLSLGDADDLSGLRQLRALHPETPVVVLSGHESRETVLEALDCGAMGFIPKSSSTPILASALRLVFNGGVYVPPLVLSSHRDGSAAPRVEPRADLRLAMEALSLTAREVQVLSLLTQGLTNKHIARHLHISDSTVRKHVSIVLPALRVRNRTEAVLEVARRGLLLNAPGSVLVEH